jgi:pheromone shutdown protein TraB
VEKGVWHDIWHPKTGTEWPAALIAAILGSDFSAAEHRCGVYLGDRLLSTTLARLKALSSHNEPVDEDFSESDYIEGLLMNRLWELFGDDFVMHEHKDIHGKIGQIDVLLNRSSLDSGKDIEKTLLKRISSSNSRQGYLETLHLSCLYRDAVTSAIQNKFLSRTTITESDKQRLRNASQIWFQARALAKVFRTPSGDPAWDQVVTNERDAILTHSLRTTPGEVVVGVVGMAHLPGIQVGHMDMNAHGLFVE